MKTADFPIAAQKVDSADALYRALVGEDRPGKYFYRGQTRRHPAHRFHSYSTDLHVEWLYPNDRCCRFQSYQFIWTLPIHV